MKTTADAPLAQRRQLVSLSEAGKFLGLQPRTLRRYIAMGLIPAYRVGPIQVRLDMCEVEDRLVHQMPTTLLGDSETAK